MKSEHYQDAVRTVTETGNVTISNLQRKLRVGYNLGAQLMQQMEENGVVTPADSKGGRDVIKPLATAHKEG